MRVLHTVAEAREALGGHSLAGRSIGFVPTMGALHDGHLSLIRLAREHADEVVFSIFVNPTQFAAGEDFERYPRTLDADIALLEAEGVEWLFAPSAAEVYPDSEGVSTPAAPPLNDRDSRILGNSLVERSAAESKRSVERVSAGPIGDRFEGAARPGHFDGMLTVVNRLFDIVRPQVAVFGQKDAQQLALVQQLVREHNLPLEIVVAPISREADGLARSSRNRYLSPEQRAAAPAIWQALQLSAAALGDGVAQALELGRAHIAAQPELSTEYFELVDPRTFLPTEQPEHALLITVVRAGNTRLLDNLPLPGR